MSKPNFNVVMLSKGKARIEIYDEIGPSWAGMIDTKLVAQQLKDAGELSEIEVRINSPGGSAFDGLAIHNILKEHPAKVNVVVDGIAASAASLIAMAGDTIRIPKNALMMIHEPATIAWGTRADFEQAIKMLGTVNEAGIATYAAKSGKTPEQVAAWMKEETWFTGQEAVDAGLATTTENEVGVEKVVPRTAKSNLGFSKVPSQFSALYGLSMCSTKEPLTMAAETTPETPAAPVAPVVQAAPVVDVTATVNTAVQTALADERKRTSTIMEICQRAGKPNLANEFIAQNLSVADVNAKMVEVLCKDRPPVGDSEPVTQSSDEDSAYKKEFAAMSPKQKAEFGTEAEYVAMRRVDDGLDVLTVGSAAK